MSRGKSNEDMMVWNLILDSGKYTQAGVTKIESEREGVEVD